MKYILLTIALILNIFFFCVMFAKCIEKDVDIFVIFGIFASGSLFNTFSSKIAEQLVKDHKNKPNDNGTTTS